MKACLAFVCAAALAACSSANAPAVDPRLPPLPPVGGPVVAAAGVVTEANAARTLPPGDARKGLPGDYYLASDRVRVLIQAPGRFGEPLGFGGNPINLALVSEDGAPGKTIFGEISAFVNAGHTPNFTRVEVVRDGRAGGPAVIRAYGHMAVLDYFNISSFIGGLGLSTFDPNVPPPLDVVATYTAAPGAPWIRVQYTLLNRTAADVPVAIGSFADSGGDLHFFRPGAGYGAMGYSDLAALIATEAPVDYWAGVAPGRAYAVVPAAADAVDALPNAAFFVAGEGVLLHDARNIYGALTHPSFVVPASGAKTYELYLVAGRDVGALHEALLALRGRATGTLDGRAATASGAAVARARIAVLDARGQVVTSYESRADGRFGGTLEPGAYTIVADKQGHPRSEERALTIAAGATESVELRLGEPARVAYRVVDEAGAPLPVKLVFVGTDPSPPDARFEDPKDDRPGTGVSRVAYALHGDSVFDGAIEIEPGRYRVVISHGGEHSLFDRVLDLAAGDNPRLDAKLVRVVDSAGYVKGDFHQHGVNSPDAATPMRERVLSYLAAGVEVIGSSDHDYLTDYGPTIAELGASERLLSIVGVESTPFDYGHFNAFPLTVRDDAPNGGAPDWGDGEGTNLSPGRLFRALREGGARIVQVNHARVADARTVPAAGFQAYFDRAALSYDLEAGTFGGDPEAQPASNELLRIALDEPLWTPDFDSMEVYNNFEIRVDGSGEAFDQKVDLLRRDWFNLLSMGKVVTAMGNTDAHGRWGDAVEAPFTYLRVADDRPGAFTPNEVLSTIKDDHDAIVSNGPFLTLHLEGSEAPSIGKLTRATGDTVRVTVKVQAPAWIAIDTVKLYSNQRYRIPPPPTGHEPMAPRRVIRLSETPGPGEALLRRVTVAAGAERFEATVDLPDFALPDPGKDAWIVAEVRGHRGLYPYIFSNVPARTPIADLMSGAFTGGVFPLAFTGPAFVDRDGNGRYDAPLRR